MSGKGIMVTGAAVAALAFGRQRPGQACSPVPPPCVELPPKGATFPANAVAFRLNQDPARRSFEGDLALRTEDGAVALPSSVRTLASGERVFSPDAPLDPNRRYVLRYDNGVCQGGNSRPQDFAFLATESLSFPASVGALNVVAEGVMEPGMGMGPRFAFVKLQLVDTPESQPFRALRSYQVEVDDRAYGYFFNVLYTLGKSSEILISSVCAQSDWLRDPCNNLSSVPAGRHRVKVIPHLLGAPADGPPLEQEIEISCDQSSSPSNMPSAPAPTNPAAGPEQGTRPDGAAACSFTTRRRANGAVELGLGLIAMRLLRRRRDRGDFSDWRRTGKWRSGGPPTGRTRRWSGGG